MDSFGAISHRNKKKNELEKKNENVIQLNRLFK